MHLSWGHTSLAFLALFPIYGWAFPSDHIGLSRRTVEFSEKIDELPSARACRKKEQQIISTALQDAIELGEYAQDMQIWHPAYRTFFDPKAPISAAQAAEATEQQNANHAFVKNVFGRAHKYLSDPASKVRIVCGANKPEETPNACRKTLYAFASGLATPTVVICPKFFELEWEKRVLLRTDVPDDKGGRINICKTPNQLDHAYSAGMILFHEMMHLEVVSPKYTKLQRTNIVDCVYGAYLCGQVARYSTSVAMANADSKFGARKHHI